MLSPRPAVPTRAQEPTCCPPWVWHQQEPAEEEPAPSETVVVAGPGPNRALLVTTSEAVTFLTEGHSWLDDRTLAAASSTPSARRPACSFLISGAVGRVGAPWTQRLQALESAQRRLPAVPGKICVRGRGALSAPSREQTLRGTRGTGERQPHPRPVASPHSQRPRTGHLGTFAAQGLGFRVAFLQTVPGRTP